MDDPKFIKKRDDFYMQLEKLWSEYRVANPHYFKTAAFQLMIACAQCLKQALEDPANTVVTWDHPVLHASCPVALDAELKPQFFPVSPQDLRNRKSTAELLFRYVFEKKSLDVLEALTRGVVALIEEDRGRSLYPPGLWQELEALPVKVRAQREHSLLFPKPFEVHFDAPVSYESGTKRSKHGSLDITFRPLVIDTMLRRALYPIIVQLRLEGCRVARLTSESRAGLIGAPNQILKVGATGENLECLERLRRDLSLTEVSFTVAVGSEVSEVFERTMRAFVSSQAEALTSTGRFLEFSRYSAGPSQVTTSPTPADPIPGEITDMQAVSEEGLPNQFYRRDGTWHIRYDGKKIHLKDLRGLFYIAHLLSNPDMEFHVRELMRVYFISEGAPGEETGAMTATEAENEGLTVSPLPDSEPILDPVARQQCRSRLIELGEELDEARQYRDPGRIERAEKETDEILMQLERAFSWHGRPRGLKDPVERARKAVGNRISYVLDKIRPTNLPLWRHLRSALRTGEFCSYKPDNPPYWEL